MAQPETAVEMVERIQSDLRPVSRAALALARYRQLADQRRLAAYGVVGAARATVALGGDPIAIETLRAFVDEYDLLNRQVEEASKDL